MVAVALLAIGASTASATAPGRNGAIAFRRYFDPQKSWGAVFTVQPDGTGARQVTHPTQGNVDDQPSWAPDGSQIAFTRCQQALPCHVFVVAPDGSGLTQLGGACPPGSNEGVCPDDGDPSFSPDSQQIAFTQSTGTVKNDAHGETWIEHSALAVMSRDGTTRRVVFQGAPYSGDLRYAAFSPDGKQLVFEWDHSGFVRPAYRIALFTVRLDGTHLHQLTPWAENDGDAPDWSPNGKWILFHSHLDDPAPQAQFYVIHPDGTGRRQITHFPPGTHVGSAGFSPDGSSIVLAKGREGGNIDIFTMRLDGTSLRRVTRSKLWESAPSWGPAPIGNDRVLAAVGRLKVTSNMDGMTTLPLRLHWLAHPSVPAATVKEVDYLIDGRLAWIEPLAPYYYGHDGNWLVTTFLKPGLHTFATKVVTRSGQTAIDSVRARVSAPPAPPSDLAGSWSREITTGDAGRWTVTINRVGWLFDDPSGGGQNQDVSYPAPGRVLIRAAIEEPPAGTYKRGGAFCGDEPDRVVLYAYSVSSDRTELTLTPIGSPGDCRRDLLSGTWTRN